MPGLDAAVSELTADREHGASWRARRAVETLLEVTEQPFSSSDDLFDTLVSAGRRLAEARPGVGAIAGAAGRVGAAGTALRFLDPHELRRLVEEEARAILHVLERAVDSIAVQLHSKIEGK